MALEVRKISSKKNTDVQMRCIVTPTRRLAQALKNEYYQAQRDKGLQAWPSPHIQTLPDFVQSLWQQWSALSEHALPQQLTAWQRLVVWEGFVKQDEYAGVLLRPMETACIALQAFDHLILWQQLQAEELWSYDHLETQALLRWSERYLQCCEIEAWTDPNLQWMQLCDALLTHDFILPSHIQFYGFDEFTPLMHRFMQILQTKQVICEQQSPENRAQQIEYLAYSSAEQQWITVAQWAKSLWQQGETSIAIVSPDIANHWSEIKSAMQRVFAPHKIFPAQHAAELPYNLSAGTSLAKTSVVTHALIWLHFYVHDLTVSEFGHLMQEPFNLAAITEMIPRSQLYDRLLDQRLSHIKIGELSRHMTWLEEYAPQTALLFKQLFHCINGQPQKALPSVWAVYFSTLLQAVGWPGERVPSSAEYQALQHWQQLLKQFAQLDRVVEDEWSADQALSYLQREANNTIFQAESKNKPIQVLGLLEAAGLSFAHIWIMDLQETALPGAADPNPFLPVSFQQKYQMPHASAEREYQIGSIFWQRIVSSSAQVHVSYAAQIKGEPARPSVFLPKENIQVIHTHLQTEMLLKADKKWLTTINIEQQGQPYLAGAKMKGGVSVLKEQSACPFRAFARFRLGAKILFEAEAFGLDKREQGILMHSALEYVGRRLQSQAQLHALTDAKRERIIIGSTRYACWQLQKSLGRRLPTLIRQLADLRLQRYIKAWLEKEQEREPYVIASCEKSLEANWENQQWQVRTDRIDHERDTNTWIFIDYKTGQKNHQPWNTPRMDEPQLPLYALLHQEHKIILRLVYLNKNKIEIKEQEMQYGDKDYQRLQTDLQQLITEFQQGAAATLPKKGEQTCRQCDLTMLCRRYEHKG